MAAECIVAMIQVLTCGWRIVWHASTCAYSNPLCLMQVQTEWLCPQEGGRRKKTKDLNLTRFLLKSTKIIKWSYCQSCSNCTILVYYWHHHISILLSSLSFLCYTTTFYINCTQYPLFKYIFHTVRYIYIKKIALYWI